MDAGLGGHGGTKLGWSSLEDINDPGAVWPKAVNRVAAGACKDRTSDEIFRQIGEELSKMGVSSVFLTREATGDNLLISNVIVSSTGVAVYPAATLHMENSSLAASESEIIGRVLAFGDVVLTADPDERVRRLFPALAEDTDTPAERATFICAPLGNAAGVFGVLVAAAPDLTHREAHNVALLAHIASMSYYNSHMAKNIDEMREKMECLDKGFGSAVSALDKSLQDIVHALTVPMEKRDPYTFGHQTRVTRLAVAVGEEMGLAQYRLDGLRLAASIHDIGKIVTPFEI